MKFVFFKDMGSPENVIHIWAVVHKDNDFSIIRAVDFKLMHVLCGRMVHLASTVVMAVSYVIVLKVHTLVTATYRLGSAPADQASLADAVTCVSGDTGTMAQLAVRVSRSKLKQCLLMCDSNISYFSVDCNVKFVRGTMQPHS